MGIWSELNPFTFGRKHRAAWNALMASYTFFHLNALQQQLVLGRVENILDEDFGRSMEDFIRDYDKIVVLNFIVYGLGEEGISPALGDDKWFLIKNPIVECAGANDVIDTLKSQLERKHGVRFDINFG